MSETLPYAHRIAGLLAIVFPYAACDINQRGEYILYI